MLTSKQQRDLRWMKFFAFGAFASSIAVLLLSVKS